MAEPQPTTWRVTPVCATDAMIEAGAARLLDYIHMPIDVAHAIAHSIINAALRASPKPPALPEPPATGDAEHG